MSLKANIGKKIIIFVASTVLTGGVTSVGTVVANKLQTADNKSFQEELNSQFVDNDKKMLDMLKSISDRLQKLEKK